VAGAGNGFTVRLVRHRQTKETVTDRHHLRDTAPVLDPTFNLTPVSVIDSHLPIPILGADRVQGEHLRREHIERRQIYFGFEVDQKLLPFAIEEFGEQCCETASTTRSMSSSNETISARRANESCSLITQRAFTGSKSWKRDRLGLRSI
jgi:hypothetical protein